VVAAAELASASTLNGLDCQTALRGSFGPQRLFGELSNPRDLLQAASADRPIVGTTSKPLLPLNPLMIFCTRVWETDQVFAHVENKSARHGERNDVQARGVRQPSRK
jgi:hypothetical protein